MNEPDILKRVLNALETLHDETGEIVNKHDNKPITGSPADLELKTPLPLASGILLPSDFKLTTAFMQANILIESAADHLMAFRRALTEPVLTFSPWTCLRVVMESSALACWLLDPKDTANARI